MTTEASATTKVKPSRQTFGRKKSALAVAIITQGKGEITINKKPLHLVEPECLRAKVFEPLMIVGKDPFRNVDIRVRTRGGGPIAQLYAIRQAIAKSIVAYAQKYIDEATKNALRDAFLAYDRHLLVADPRKVEPKKFGGPSARTRYQKSYR